MNIDQWINLEDVKFQPGGLTAVLHSESGKIYPLSISFISPFSFRVMIGEDNNRISCVNSKLSIEETKGYSNKYVLYLETSKTILEIHTLIFTLKIRDKASLKLITETNPLDLDASGTRLSPGCGIDASESLQCLSWHLSPNEHFFGFGEKFINWDKRGQSVVCWNRNAYGAGDEKSYKNIPFFFSSRKYAILVNTSTKVVFDLGKTANFSSFFTVFEPVLDFFFIQSDSYSEMMKEYYNLTGWPHAVPLWSLGLWVSVFGDHRAGNTMDEQGVLREIENAYNHSFPIDVLHLDPFWMGESGYCSFQWDPSYFPNPEIFIKELNHRNIRLCLWEHPYLDTSTPIFEEAKKSGFLIQDQLGNPYIAPLAFRGIQANAKKHRERYNPAGIVDFSNPQAYEWYQNKHRPLIEMGVSTFKTDFGEEIPEDGFFHNGKNGREMHNIYPVLYNQAVYNVLAKYQEKPIVWGRSGFTGIHQYPLCWSGDPLCDFDSLAATFRGGLSLSVSGIPFWSHDVGGFIGHLDSALFIRWLQFAIFCSHIRLHGTTSRLPWKMDSQTCQTARKLIHLRYQLLPYLWKEVQKVWKDGVLLLQPLFWEYPEDPTTFWIWWEYFLGESILVAPVLNSEGEIDLYFPSGKWLDFWSGELITGPCWQKKKIPLEEIPIFIRENAIIPRVRNPIFHTEAPWKTLSLDIFSTDNMTESIPIGEDIFAFVEVNHTPDTSRIIIESPELRNWILRWHDIEKPKDVMVNSDSVKSKKWHWYKDTFNIFLKDKASFTLRIHYI